MATRRRIRSSSPIQKLSYLFRHHATFYELTLHLEDKLREEVRSLAADAVRRRSVDEAVADIVGKYMLDVPMLHPDQIAELPSEQTWLQVPPFSQNRVFSGPGPHFVPATAFRIRLPFTGDANLFQYPNSGYALRIQAEITADALILTHVAEHPDAETIKRDFRHAYWTD